MREGNSLEELATMDTDMNSLVIRVIRVHLGRIGRARCPPSRSGFWRDAPSLHPLSHVL